MGPGEEGVVVGRAGRGAGRAAQGRSVMWPCPGVPQLRPHPVRPAPLSPGAAAQADAEAGIRGRRRRLPSAPSLGPARPRALRSRLPGRRRRRRCGQRARPPLDPRAPPPPSA